MRPYCMFEADALREAGTVRSGPREGRPGPAGPSVPPIAPRLRRGLLRSSCCCLVNLKAPLAGSRRCQRGFTPAGLARRELGLGQRRPTPSVAGGGGCALTPSPRRRAGLRAEAARGRSAALQGNPSARPRLPRAAGAETRRATSGKHVLRKVAEGAGFVWSRRDSGDLITLQLPERKL